MRGEAVTQAVDGDAFAQSGTFDGVPASFLQGSRGEMRIDAPTGKQPIHGAGGAPPGAQYFQQAGGEQGVTVAFAFALLHARSRLRCESMWETFTATTSETRSPDP